LGRLGLPMKYRLHCVLFGGALTAALSLACSTENQANPHSSTSGGASIRGNITSVGGRTATSSGIGPIITSVGGAVTIDQVTAEDSEDGTKGISAEEAAQVLAAPEDQCQGWGVEAESESSVIEFLVDVSGSMGDAAPSTGGQSKWAVTRAALKNAVQRLPPSFGVGIAFYPNMAIVASANIRPSSACVDGSKNVPVAKASVEQQTRILAAIDSIEPDPLGATPTHDAYDLAVEQLKNANLPGKRYVVLITDGQPTQSQGCIGTGSKCDPQPAAPIVDAITRARAEYEIQTFLVGSPGSERNACTAADVRGWLSEAARAGNTAHENCSDSGPTYCHFDVSQATDFADALSAALVDITKSMISCNYGVPAPSGDQKLDPTNVNMIYVGTDGSYLLILPNQSSACDKGWNYTDATRSAVQICGITCELLQNHPGTKLNILFGCAQKIDTILL
jgi:hypothetical protein